LQKHECNYALFLLEMQAAIWGMDHFSTYLRRKRNARGLSLSKLHRRNFLGCLSPPTSSKC
jgi:hypothetical protein